MGVLVSLKDMDTLGMLLFSNWDSLGYIYIGVVDMVLTHCHSGWLID